MNLSIIIPCYNSEKFLSRTLQMLLNEKLDNTEIILINDGSTDQTAKIIRDYSCKTNRIKFIDKENEGVSKARNDGLSIAQGKFIYFLDSDDAIESGTIDFFNKLISENDDIDFFAFGYKSMRSNKVVKNYQNLSQDYKYFTSKEIQTLFFLKKINLNICSALFKNEILRENRLVFTNGVKIGEDVEFIIKYLKLIKKALYRSRLCFNYLLRDDSATQGYSSYSKAQFESFQLFKKLLSDNELQNEKNFFIANCYISNLYRYFISDLSDIELNKAFVENKAILRKYWKVNSMRALLLKFFNILPIKILLRIKKY